MSANAFVMSFMATPHNPPAHAAASQVRFGFGTILDVVGTQHEPNICLVCYPGDESALPSTCSACLLDSLF